MIHKSQILFFIVTLGFFYSGASAQDTDNNKRKRDREDAINTRKKTPVKIIEYIVGKWEVDRVYNGDRDVTAANEAQAGKSIEFNSEGRYSSYSDRQKIDSGAYRLNEAHGILYLESETGKPISQWNISFTKSGVMTLQPRESTPNAESFKYVYTRTE
jgi:hypothetical protein